VGVFLPPSRWPTPHLTGGWFHSVPGGVLPCSPPSRTSRLLHSGAGRCTAVLSPFVWFSLHPLLLVASQNFSFLVRSATYLLCFHYWLCCWGSVGLFAPGREAVVVTFRSGPCPSVLSRVADMRLTGSLRCVSPPPQPPVGWTERGRVLGPSRTPQAPEPARSAAVVPERSVEHPAGFRGLVHLSHGHRGRRSGGLIEGCHPTASSVTTHPVSSVLDGRPHGDSPPRRRGHSPVLET